MTIKKELEYFHIGSSFGGNQDWLLEPTMHFGGCGAVTACDASICLALYKGKRQMIPFVPDELTRRSYVRFAMAMKPYLSPRWTGINTLEIFMDGFAGYIDDVGVTGLTMRGFSGHEDEGRAEALIMKQLDAGIPIPYLVLYHKDPAFRDFKWHWFLLAGYEKNDSGFFVKTATYGEGRWFPFHDLWNTGYEERGGMVIIDVE
jgi:hypothetical protein